MLSIALQNVEAVSLDESLIVAAAEHAYQEVNNRPTECTIRVVGRDEGHELNLTFRQKNKPTNVLSFSYDDNDLETDQEYLGDIVLCSSVIETEAGEQGKPLEHHYAHLVVHGVLHLCGYDHEKTIEAQKMEQLEIKILAKLNINNPYLSA